MPEVLAPKPETDVTVLPVVLVAVPVPLSPRLTKYRKLVLFAAPVLAAAWAWGSAVGLHFMMTNESSPVAVAERGTPDGARLYAEHCARCHGERGDGRGLSPLDPPARHFGAEAFKFGTTSNRLCPTDEDLMRVIQDGIPGSAMPSFAQLSEEQRRAIAGHVRRLTWENLFAKLRAKDKEEFGDYVAADIAAQTDKLLQPGQPLEVPATFSDPHPELLARGRGVFVQYCAPCHGLEGRGDGPQVQVNENGTPAKPRDLTKGLYKGGGEPEDLYARIMLGIPGTPMPASSNLSPQDVDALIAYVRSLPRNGATVAGR